MRTSSLQTATLFVLNLFYFSITALRGFFCRSSAILSLWSQNSLYPQETFTLFLAPFPDFMNTAECCKRLLAVSLPGKIDNLCPPSVVCFQLYASPGTAFPLRLFQGSLDADCAAVLTAVNAARGEALCVLCPSALLLPCSEPSLQTAPTGNEPNKLQINADLEVLYWQYTNVGG